MNPPPDGGYAGGNTAEGTQALFSLTTGIDNAALGFQALYSNTTGSFNTAEGFRALFSLTSGIDNTGLGFQALYYNTTGNYNTAEGFRALFRTTTGSRNTANGVNALYSNTTGGNNTALGVTALYSNTTASSNTAVGFQALVDNTTGDFNTANGNQALYNNTTGVQNTAIGHQALGANSTGDLNIAIGIQALLFNTAGNANVAAGCFALYNTTGSNNVAIGNFAGQDLTTGTGNVCIGDGVLGVAAENNTTRIRNIYFSVADGRAVYANGDGKIGTLASSRRYKEEIKPMGTASDSILALKPVTFRYKKEVNPTHGLSFGLVAEDVAEVNPELVTLDAEGKPETVRYEAVNAMLLNEFLKEHRKNQEQADEISQLRATVARQDTAFVEQQNAIKVLAASLKDQASQIRKVSTQIELNSQRPASQVVINDP